MVEGGFKLNVDDVRDKEDTYDSLCRTCRILLLCLAMISSDGFI